MRRGDVVTVVLPGAYGKPRPAVLIQDDVFEALPSVTVLPVTSDVRDLPVLRVDIPPGPPGGLRRASQVMVDKVQTVPRTRIGRRAGALDPQTLERVAAALSRFLGLG